MALIVVPIRDGADGESSLRAPLLEVARTLDLEARTRAGDRTAAALGSFSIVPHDEEEWDDDVVRPLAERGSFLLETAGTDGRTDVSFPGRLSAAVDRALRDVAFGAAGRQSEGYAVVTLVPVGRIAGDAPGGGARAGTFEEAFRDLSRVLEDISATDRERGGGVSFANFRVVPWLFADGGVDAVPDVAFRGPKGLGADRVRPIVHGGRTAGADAPIPWEGYGEARLYTELLFLQALSCHRDEFDKVFPRVSVDPGRRTYYRTHSSVFEYPLVSLARELLLRRLRDDAPGRGRLVPSVEGLDSLLDREAREALVESARNKLGVVAKVIDRNEIPQDALDFGGASPGVGNAEPDFEIAPAPDELRDVGATRRADILHERVVAALEQKSREPFDDLFNAALDRAQSQITEETADLEILLRGAFDTHGGANGGDRTERGPARSTETAAAAARTVNALGALADGLDALGSGLDSREGKRPEDVLDTARASRDEWIAREGALIQASARLPSLSWSLFYGILAGVGGFFLAYVLLWVIGFVEEWTPTARFLASAGVAVGAAAATVWALRRRVRRHVEAWEHLGGSLSSEANRWARTLVGIANRRLRSIKYAATTGLRRGIAAAHERFRVELGGFARTIDDELAERTARRNELDERTRRHAPAESGRFHVSLDGEDTRIGAALRLNEGHLHERLEQTVGDALTLRDMPRRVPVSEYDDILRALTVQALEDASELVARFREAAESCWSEAVRVARNTALLAGDGPARSLAKPATFVLLGVSNDDRLPGAGTAGIRRDDTRVIDEPAVRQGMVAECAVAVTVQSRSASKEGSRG